ncbi:CHASE domain-containing protein [Hydrogenophaga sp. PAMC20947]|uniref:PAS domain-containing hybrid sensor histidine kinase/response regulator n=1 Tax=Hydrogenophaga sp. PAMC20947 TaxID=2565558 RepID=UPI00109D877F|nr:CHASE domain-containing protein [Hydrogenophaga sp. PAMC20947]QCB47200.1 response regulator [Hydrogenophaga sp. PAMC20947]
MTQPVFWRFIAPWALVTLLTGAAITVLLIDEQEQRNTRTAHEQMQLSAERITDEVANRFQLYQYGARGLRGMVAASLGTGLTHSKILAYSRTRDVEGEFQGSRGFGYIERVPARQSDSYVALARADGAPDFAIRQLTPHDEERFIIRYIEPLQNNRKSLGLDIGSEANRRNAAWAALRNNKATITAPITLVQASGASLRSFLLLLPVYRPGLPIDTMAQRETAGVGWAYTPLVTDEVLKSLSLNENLLHLSMKDVTDSPIGEVFYNQEQQAQSRFTTGLATSFQRDIFGRRWQLDFDAYPDFVTGLNLTRPLSVGMVGGLITVLLAVLQGMWMIIMRRRREVGEANASLAAIVENASDAIMSESLEGRILTWNNAAEAMFGHTRESVLGKPIATLLLPAQRQHEDQDLILLASRQRSLAPFESTRLHRDGRLIDVSVTASNIHGEMGQITGVALLMRDVSEHKRHEQALLDLNAQLEQRVEERTQELNVHRAELERALRLQHDERLRLQSIIEGTGAGTWESNFQTRELRINEKWANILGYTKAELEPVSAATWEAHMHPDDLVEAQALLLWHIHGELPKFELEARMRHRDGHWVWVLSRGELKTRDANGEPEWMYGTHLDITARKSAQERLRNSEVFLERVSKAAGVGGWRLSLVDQKITWTSQTRLISEVDDNYEPAFETALAFYPPEAQPGLTAAIQNTIDTGEPFDLELPYITARGEHRWVRSVGEAEYGPSAGAKSPVALVGALMDFTERHEIAETLIRAQRDAEAANRSKSAFLANMSHEIRTPLNAVLGVFYLLSDTRLDASQRLLLSKAQLAGRSLLGIVNDVLDLAKIESGELLLTAEPYCLPDLLREIEAIYAPQATQKGVGFHLDEEQGLPQWLLGDVQRVRQILTNLIGNALKFTETGGIELATRRIDAGDSERIRLSVKDTGIGIPGEVQANLFKPFVQADDTTTRRFGGTGLGLSIIRQLSEAMGGHAGLNSVLGEGSEFWVELPLMQPSKGELAGSSSAQEPLEIVVVDDNQSERAAMVSLVRSLGWRAIELSSGEELISHVAERIESGRPAPDALLVDWNMPGLSGLEALNMLSQRVGAGKLPAALVVSVYDRERISDLTHTQVTDKILTKPLEISALFNAISEGVSRREGNTTKLLQNTKLMDLQAQWLSGVTVLLVDDGEINLEIAQHLLEKYSAKVFTATDGEQALAVLRQHPGEIDAVLMDIQMPVMDGLEATRRLRQDMGLHQLPVIALTAGALVQERERALQKGMNDFMTKPLEPETLIRTVRKHVEKARGAPLPMVRALDPFKNSTHWPIIEGIDANSAEVRLDHDLKLFLRMLGWINSDFTDLVAIISLEQITSHLNSDRSRNDLRGRVHKLRGSAGTLGANQLHALATAAEDSLTHSRGDEAQRVLALSQGLRQLIAASQAAINEGLKQESQSLDVSSSQAQPASQKTLKALADLLRAHDLQALDMLTDMKGALANKVGAEKTMALSHAMESLDFTHALRLLEEATAP